MFRRTNFEDVLDFHERFNVPVGSRPQLLTGEAAEFRLGFLKEELKEILEAQEQGDLEGVADGLVDLVYVALGMAAWMGLPWQALWNEVQRANMSKVPAGELATRLGKTLEEIGARHPFDVRKPEGWTPPNIKAVLAAYTPVASGGSDV